MGRSRCSGPPSTHLQSRLVLDRGWTGNWPEPVGGPGVQAPSPRGKGHPCWACSATFHPEKGREEGCEGTGGGGGSTRQCCHGSQAHPLPGHQSPSPADLTPPLGASEPDTKARGVAAPSFRQADSGGLSHTQALGPGDPKLPRRGLTILPGARLGTFRDAT